MNRLYDSRLDEQSSRPPVPRPAGLIPPAPDEIWWLSFVPGTLERYVAALTAAGE